MSAQNIMGRPLGYCIYCGQREGDFTDEHIVPFALGGLHILPRCVCSACQKGINQCIEEPLLNKLLVPARLKNAYPFRKRKKKRETVRVTRILSILDKRVTVENTDVSIQNYVGPSSISYVAEKPRLLSKSSSQAGPSFGVKVDLSHAQSGEGFMLLPPIDFLWLLARMLAKAAHAYAYFMDVPFNPVLLGVLRGTEQSFVQYIGEGVDQSGVPEGSRYHLNLRQEEGFVIVSIGIFLGTPLSVTHDVIVGLSELDK